MCVPACFNDILSKEIKKKNNNKEYKKLKIKDKKNLKFGECIVGTLCSIGATGQYPGVGGELFYNIYSFYYISSQFYLFPIV